MLCDRRESVKVGENNTFGVHVENKNGIIFSIYFML